MTARVTLIVVEKYSASRFWSQIRHYRATLAQCVAMMLRTLMLQPVDPDEKDHCLRDMLYFLPVSAREKEAFEERYGVRIMNTYGSTESVGWVLTDPPTGERNWPSIGRVGLGYEAKIVDDEGNELPAGEVGEIWLDSDQFMLGYLHEQVAPFAEYGGRKWLKTGDYGWLDEDGFLYFKQRIKNMIKVSGVPVYPSEIEAAAQEKQLQPVFREAAS